jgi:type VI secretion system secreted protein VgrG
LTAVGSETLETKDPGLSEGAPLAPGWRRERMSDAPARFHFQSDAVANDTFHLHTLLGREEMSTPYRFEMELLTRKKPESIKLEDLITKPSHLAIRHSVALHDGGRGNKVFNIHGMLSELELVDKMQDYVRYRAVLVPRLWKLSLTRQSRIFQDMDILTVIKQVLTDSKTHQFSSEDYELKTSSSYPQQEFIVQYNESDLDFLHRWLEHYGIFYFFEQSESREKVVFCDAAAAYLPSLGNVRYRPSEDSVAPGEAPGGDTSRSEETIKSFRYRMSKLPKSVLLKDYNYRTPSVENKAEADVKDSKGEGKVYEYGDHFKTPSEGKALAKLRAEEITFREKAFEGTSDVRPFRPGLVVSLAEHFHSGLNRDYAITSIVHEMKRSRSSDGGVTDAIEYRNEFKCIPSDVVFRPERKVPWPSIHGFMNATIDAGGDGKYAEIDNHGRYKVKLPFDLSDQKDGKASRYVRMAQPYGGDGMGMHSPLHKGTEVIVAFLDGDPDRPVILSSVPNPEKPSVVAAANQTQCDWKSGGNNEIRFEDLQGSEQIYLHAQKDRLTVVENDEKKQVKHDQIIEVTSDRTKTISGNQSEHVVKDKSIQIDGNHKETINGTKDMAVHGTHTEMVDGNVTITENSSKTETVTVSVTETIGVAKALTIGAAYQVSVGAAMNESVGAAKAMEIGGNYAQAVGGNKLVSVGGDVSESFAKNHSENTAEKFALVVGKEIVIDAKEAIVLNCGKASIALKKDGTILIEGKDLTLKGSGEIVAQASKDMTLKGKNILQN